MSRLVRVFEHETLRVGDTSWTHGSEALSSSEFEALVRFNDAQGQRYFNVGYRSITFRQYVGFLQVGTLAIEVLPKADRGRGANDASWRDLLIEMLRVAREVNLHAPVPAWQRTDRLP